MFIQLDLMISKVLSNLNDSMILLEDGIFQHVELKRLGYVSLSVFIQNQKRENILNLKYFSFW